jgi:hypothetical protein
MNRSEFNMLDDENLIWLCVEPIIQQVQGKNLRIKSRIYAQLNDAQRALLLFQVLYGHAKQGMLLFFQQISYLANALDLWPALQSTMKFFNDPVMLDLVGKMENACHASQGKPENINGLDELDQLYRDNIATTVKLVSSYIRNNAAEFSQLED